MFIQCLKIGNVFKQVLGTHKFPYMGLLNKVASDNEKIEHVGQ